jgi:hypothetical protein
VYTPARSVTPSVAVPELEPLVARIVCVPAAVPGVYRPDALIVPTAELPPAIVSTDHVAPVTVAVNCCVCHNVIAAAFGVTVTVPVAIVTVAVAGALVPPAPAQVNEYEVLAVKVPVL